jgi:hypothetical protein
LAKRKSSKQQRRRVADYKGRPQTVAPVTRTEPAPTAAAPQRPPVPSLRSAAPSRPAFGLDPSQERAYLVSDLKRIGAVAASLFALLIVLSLVLPLVLG